MRSLGRHEAPVDPSSDPYPKGFVPRHRSELGAQFVNHPASPGCKHAQFMKSARRTTVPECPNARAAGSLYCEHHQVHPAPGGSGGKRRRWFGSQG